ncbi:MAG: tRNA pseudouridine(55) synthase, partial [Flavobacteriales bacterium]
MDSFNFPEGEVLLFDKEFGLTSFAVVSRARGIIKRKLNVRKIKVGHAGTLDPLATGLLVLCTGKKTKTI